ncbi:hypothetical protein ACTNBL_01810 [Enterococcus villorum]|uniref:Uncharacterized protein n=2 Tax=Enterococcus villorum TaxID=112904 RepID=A0A511J3L8_9ENTE|nr:hypothetical protein [Enterococcus villorum]EOH92108.1 hypothetical protein UAO_00558 [Enterococcus villorum ATCC 700913]EOW76604.1 hypothetical protein I591_01912 [Enterococcus villorum ATCC 700913]GEL92293.1 hypothetical protein EVI01_16300 [Enterococcus villorum]
MPYSIDNKTPKINNLAGIHPPYFAGNTDKLPLSAIIQKNNYKESSIFHSTDNKKTSFINHLPKAYSEADNNKLPLYANVQKDDNKESPIYVNVQKNDYKESSISLSTDNNKTSFINHLPKAYSEADNNKLPLYANVQKNDDKEPIYTEIIETELYTSYGSPNASLLSKLIKFLENPRANLHLKQEMIDDIQRLHSSFINHTKDSQTDSFRSAIKEAPKKLFDIVINLKNYPVSHKERQDIVSKFEKYYATFLNINNRIINRVIKSMGEKVRPIVTQPQKDAPQQRSHQKKIKEIKASQSSKTVQRNEPLKTCLPEFCFPSR